MNYEKTLSRLIHELDTMPIVAILRGIRSDEAVPIVEALYDEGIRVAEVPLNSPDPFDTIELLTRHFGTRMLIGAGTVVDPDDVKRLAAIGCMLCVAPNTDVRVIKTCIEKGIVPMPGVASATEAFEAVDAGACFLKVFPAAANVSTLAALRTVLPQRVRLLAVGGVQSHLASSFRAAGAYGFGLGADIYRPGWSAHEVAVRAREWTARVSRLAINSVQLLAQPQALVGESVSMDGRDVIWLDPPRARLLRWVQETGQVRELHLAHLVRSIGRLPDGQWAGITDHCFCRIDITSGAVALGPDGFLKPGCRFNDMVLDEDGGLWAGSMHGGLLSGKGGLFYAPNIDAPMKQVAAGLGAANGMAFNQGRDTLYVVDTQAKSLLAYPWRKRHAGLDEPALVSDFMGLPGKPDGLAAAADGTLWVAMWGGGCILQLASDGTLLQSIPIPAPHVSSLCFDAMGDAYVSTSRLRLSVGALQAHPHSGGLFRIDRESLRTSG
jgi:Entner-Doudoroff aldolase